jgi:sulfate permease, SulP family
MADSAGSTVTPATLAARLRHVPPFDWLCEYRAVWPAGDIIAGIALAAYAIPVSLAYATLAGLPPQVGVYGNLLGGLGYADMERHRTMSRCVTRSLCVRGAR